MNGFPGRSFRFCLLILALAACGRQAATEVMTTQDLADRLRDSGFQAQVGEVVENPAFDTEGRILSWDSVQIEVFEFPDQGSRSATSDAIDRENLTINGIPLLRQEKVTLWAGGNIIVLYHGLDGGTIMLLNGLLGDPLTNEASQIDEPFPPAVVAAIRYAAQLYDIDPGLIQVEGYEQVDWPDACLGLPGPDETCAQVITSGWKVDLRTSEIQMEVRTDLGGAAIRARDMPE